MDPWGVDLIVARTGRWTGDELRSIRRDVERGRAVRLRPGVYAQAVDLGALRPEERHVLRIRAWHALAAGTPVFSHWSAAVIHGFAVLGPHLDRVHVTVGDDRRRGQDGVAAHVHPLLDEEVQESHGLFVTVAGRTVVDVASAGTFEEGVVTADSALAAGVSRRTLEAAIELAGPRRSSARIRRAIGFAEPGGTTAGESLSRCTMHRLGSERPVLQHEVRDHHGLAGILDFFFPDARAGGEFDGRVKYLDPRYAAQGAGRAVYAEKRREDRVRSCLGGLARWGWEEARSPQLLAPVLRRAGVRLRD